MNVVNADALYLHPASSPFAVYVRIAGALIAQAGKEEEVAECARILALAVAQYELKFGELPRTEYIAMLERNDPIDADTAEALAVGMEQFVGVLGKEEPGLSGFH